MIHQLHFLRFYRHLSAEDCVSLSFVSSRFTAKSLSVDACCVISPPSSFELLLPMCSRFLPVSFALAPIKRRFLTTKILPHANFSPSSVGFIIFQRKWDFYGRIFRYLLLTVFMEVKRNLELCCLEIPSSSKSPDRRRNFSIPEQNI